MTKTIRDNDNRVLNWSNKCLVALRSDQW